MNRHAVAAVVFALAASPVLAQGDRSSHAPISEWSSGANDPQRARELAERLRAGLGQPMTPPPNVDPEVIKRLLDTLQKQDDETLRKLAQNPAIRRQLENLDASNPQLREQLKQGLPPNVRDQANMNKLVDDLKQRAGVSRPGAPGGAGTAPPVGPSTTPPVQPPGGGPGPTTRSSPPNLPPPRIDPRLPDPADEVRTARMREFFRRMDRWVPESVKGSDAMRRFSRRLGEVDWSKATGSKLIPDQLRGRLNMGGRLQGTGRALERAVGRLDVRAPRMPRMSAPNLPSGPSMPNLGAPGAPSAAGAGGAFTVMMIVAAVIVGAFLVWKLLVQPMKLKRAAPAEWHLGSWPVDPARVRTREELIKAFDYLALLRGGQPARHWHHREVANHLGTADQARRQTADRLADAYAQARYTPPGEPLPDAQIDLARRDLCTLAEVRSAECGVRNP